MRKTILSVIACGLVAGSCCLSASAETIKATTSSHTDGKQSITITSEGYMDYNIPTPSVEIYFYGVRAYTPGYGNSNNITTSFSILGKLNQTSSSKSFRKSGSGEICDYKSNGIETLYNNVSSTITTSSTVYGSSSQECNYNCK